MLQSNSVTLPSEGPSTVLSAQRIATLLCFFSLGFATAAWAPLIPFAQQRMNFNHAEFGALLLCAGVGSMLAMAATGYLIQKFGARVIIASIFMLLSVVLPLLALVESPWLFGLSLFFFGAAAGSLGVAINLQAVIVEKQYAKPMMSHFHGMCSLGGLSGVLLMTALVAFGLHPLIAALVIVALLVLLGLFAVPQCLKREDLQQQTQASHPAQAKTRRGLPTPLVALIGVICFIAFLSEGAAMDWSGIYLNRTFGIDAAYTGLAYSCFAVSMTLGRFAGARIQQFWGEHNTILLSALGAGIGLATVVLAPHWWVVLFGYGIVGLGCANIVPIMFSRVGRQTQMPQAVALSYVSSFAYTGALLGPALVGLGSEMFGLNVVFIMIAFALSSIAILNRFTCLPMRRVH